MNVENILKVADAIEQHRIAGLGFHMNYLVSSTRGALIEDKLGIKDCGTVMCIAGWASAISGRKDNPAFYHARDFLGIDPKTSRHLFYAANHPDSEVGEGPLDDITATQAVAVLRHLAATGEVDWTIAPE